LAAVGKIQAQNLSGVASSARVPKAWWRWRGVLMSTSLPQARQNSPVFCHLPSILRSRPLPNTQNVSSPSHHLLTGPKSSRSLSSSLSLRLAAVRSDLHPELPSWQRLDQFPAGLCGRVCYHARRPVLIRLRGFFQAHCSCVMRAECNDMPNRGGWAFL